MCLWLWMCALNYLCLDVSSFFSFLQPSSAGFVFFCAMPHCLHISVSLCRKLVYKPIVHPTFEAIQGPNPTAFSSSFDLMLFHLLQNCDHICIYFTIWKYFYSSFFQIQDGRRWRGSTSRSERWGGFVLITGRTANGINSKSGCIIGTMLMADSSGLR